MSAERGRGIVEEFVGLLRALGRELLAERGDPPNLLELLRMGKRGDVPRSGMLGSGSEYSFHGFGCRLVAADQREVDVDFTAEGQPIFDLFRLRRFAVSAGYEGDELDGQLAAEIAELMEHGRLLELRAGWFTTVPDCLLS